MATNEDDLLAAIKRAVTMAIHAVGIDAFKRTSLFMSSRKES